VGSVWVGFVVDGLRERAWRYIESARRALGSLRLEHGRLGSLDVSRLLDAAERYVRDAEYYYSRGDYATALASASYAEGLIDSLKYLGVAEARWPSGAELERRVLVGGTFELLHPGHLELLRYASSLGRLYVVVARDSTVERVKGRRPILSETARLELVSSVRYVYEAFLGSERDIMDSVERVKPSIIVLGPDQAFSEEDLALRAERRLGYRPEVVRMPGGKREFSGGLRSVSDIVARICEERCRH
jgi:FAD synthetase